MSVKQGAYIYPAGQTPYTTQNAVGQPAQAVMKGTSRTTFGQGFKVGYTATTSFFNPFLSYRAARQEQRLMRMQAELAEMQAKANHTAADDVMRGGERHAAAVGYQAGQSKSSQRVQQASAGVEVGAAGSSAETLSDIDILTEIQVNQITANAVAESFGFRKQAVMDKNRAEAFKSTARSISPWAAAISTMANDAMSMMDAGMGDGGGGGKGEGNSGIASFQDFGAFFKNFQGLGGK